MQSTYFINRHMPERVCQRAATNYTVDEDGCWISNYFKMRGGYAQLQFRPEDDTKEKIVLAHRAAYTHHNGPIPDGMTVHHKCYKRACVNPDHLDLMTRNENSRRNNGDDFPLGQCKWGHGPEHWKVTGRKRRITSCMECNRQKGRTNRVLRRLLEAYDMYPYQPSNGDDRG